jgi:hypothetical protein
MKRIISIKLEHIHTLTISLLFFLLFLSLLFPFTMGTREGLPLDSVATTKIGSNRVMISPNLFGNLLSTTTPIPKTTIPTPIIPTAHSISKPLTIGITGTKGITGIIGTPKTNAITKKPPIIYRNGYQNNKIQNRFR